MASVVLQRVPHWPTRAEWVAVSPALQSMVQPEAAPDARQCVEMLQQEDIAVPQERDAFLQRVREHVRQDADMHGGMLSEYLPVWRQLAEHLPGDETLQRVLGWLEHGVPLWFCCPHDSQKQREPHHERKVRAMRAALLQAGRSATQIEDDLRQQQPAAAAFPNRDTAEERPFMRSQVAAGVATGVVLQWPFASMRPWLLHGLSVATDAYGKQRLILDARYLNLFLQYFPFAYERLKDVLAFTEAGYYIIVDDLRAGYQHLRLAAEYWGLLGFELDGELYVFTCLPFGLSQAPYLFTQVLNCVHRLPRQAGWQLVAMVDDSGMTQREHGKLARRSLVMVMAWFKAALGLVQSFDKRVFWPSQSEKLLGFVVDTRHGAFRVPERKLQRFARDAAQLSQGWDAQLWRSVAGQLAAFAPAVRLAPLLVRWLRQLASGDLGAEQSSWMQQFLRFWQQQLP